MHTSVIRIATDDGRTLQVAESGDSDGIPVVFHSGTPGSYVLPASIIQDAKAHGVRLISYDRPGYGESTPWSSRTVGSAAQDVAAIAKYLHLERLGTIGASGGGPHALACAALLPDLIAGAVAMESLAPFSASGLDWFAKMDEGSTAKFRAAEQGRTAMTEFVAPAAAGILNTTVEQMVEGFRSMSNSAEKVAILEAGGKWFFDTSRVALKNGNEGWIDDNLAFCMLWGFDVAQIQVPVLVMHGVQDTMVPVAHGRWLGEHIPSADARYFDDDDHFTLFERQFPVARLWLVNQMR
jgi:pimeloyl-ACP methyl ester carboxylesterase